MTIILANSAEFNIRLLYMEGQKHIVSHEPDVNDDSDVSDSGETLDDVKEKMSELERQLEKAQEENRKLRSSLERLRQENEALKNPPNFVGTVSEIIEDQSKMILKKHGDNQEFITDIPNHVDLDPGDRVSLNDSMSVTEIIQSTETDARAQAMEVDEKPQVTYSDIGGLDEQLRELREATENPILQPERFEEVGVQPPKGVLLYGPPGTGKTMMAKAVANKADAKFLKLAASELAQKFIGEGARLVRDLFEVAEENAPAIIFIDEIDAIAAKRTDTKSDGGAEVQRTLMQLLSEMDGFENRGDVRIMAATNRFDMLDDAILRPGRFDRIIEVPVPTEEGREQIFHIHSRDMNLSGDIEFADLSEETEGFTGADIQSVCTEAGMKAIRDDRKEVRRSDFDDAIEKIKNDDSASFNTRGFQ